MIILVLFFDQIQGLIPQNLGTIIIPILTTMFVILWDIWKNRLNLQFNFFQIYTTETDFRVQIFFINRTRMDIPNIKYNLLIEGFSNQQPISINDKSLKMFEMSWSTGVGITVPTNILKSGVQGAIDESLRLTEAPSFIKEPGFIIVKLDLISPWTSVHKKALCQILSDRDQKIWKKSPFPQKIYIGPDFIVIPLLKLLLKIEMHLRRFHQN